jgi:hypothetical protein
MSDLVFTQFPVVTFATNTFVRVPTILQFEDTPLLSVVREEKLGFTSEIPIYHSDGTYLGKVRGTRIYPTEEGKKVNFSVRRLPDTTVCELDSRTVFEIRHQAGDAFRASAELYTPTGFFVKSHDGPMPELIDASGQALRVGGVTMIGNWIEGARIGVLVRADGSCAIGVT